VHAADVFDARHEVHTFEEGIATARLVIGTSPRERPWSIPVEEVGAVFAQAVERGLAACDVALVFGPEDRGLSNEELARCHRVAFVPTAGEYASLNLAQAVVICLYEWLQVSRGMRPAALPHGAGGAVGKATAGLEQIAATGTDAAAGSVPATASAQAAALDDLRSVLEGIGFLDGDQGDRVMATVASMLTRGGLDEREVRILRGLARQIRWAARTGGKPSLHGR
jgi:TrmH family RNA methyltransferase